MNNLKPCPSCKSVEGPLLCDRISYAAVVCRDCGMSGPQMDFGSEACDAWDALPRHVEPQPIETFKDEWRGTHENAPYFLFRHKTIGWGQGYMLLGVPEFPVSLACTDYLQRIEDVTHWLPMPPLPEGK